MTGNSLSREQVEAILERQKKPDAQSEAKELKELSVKHEVKDKRLGQILVEKGLVSVKQLSEALYLQKELQQKQKKKLKIGEILLFSETISLPQLQEALRNQTSKVEAARKEAEKLKRKLDRRAQRRKELSLDGDDDEPQNKSFIQRFVKKITK